MSASFKLKVIALALGTSISSKKTFFSNCAQVSNRFRANYKLSVGVDIVTADCYYNQHDELATLSIWDIGNQRRFDFIRRTFYKGAAGCLLFFNVKDDQALSNLAHLIIEIRSVSGDIPIYLVGNVTNNDACIDHDCLDLFLEENELNGYFLIPNQINLNLTELTRTIIETRQGYSPLLPKLVLTKATRNLHDKFIKFFITCPVCNSKNHQSYLSRFYLNPNPALIKFKERLISLMEESEIFDDIYLNKIRLGIPCCDCYKNIFSLKN